VKLEKGYTYVLRCADDRLYVGSTRDLEKRIEAHQKGKVKTTKHRRPGKLIHAEKTANYSEARKRELYLKSGTGRDWLKSTIG
jgi:putative endonuclease